MESESNLTPFKDSLSSEILNPGEDQRPISEIRNLENHPDKVVRVHTIQEATLEDLNDRTPEGMKKIAIQEAQHGKALFEEVGKYINVPDHQFVIGERPEAEGNPTVYTVTDKVEGTDLDYEIFGSSKNMQNQTLSDFFMSLIDYYSDVSQKGGEYLRDITREEQYIYGHTAKDATDRIYLVDLDVVTYDFDPNSKLSKVALSGLLRQLDNQIREAAEHRQYQFSQPIEQLSRLRERLAEP